MSQRLVPLSVGVGVACAWAVAFLGAQSRPAPAGPGQPAVDFATEIHPVLQANCLGCHGDKLKLSKLDLRTREAAIEGGAHGAALVPGDAERSPMYRHVAGLAEPAMPMRGEPLAAAEVAALKRWIDEGAVWPAAAATAAAPANAAAMFEDRPLTDEERNYWAFKLPVQTPLPASSGRISRADRSVSRAGARLARAHAGAARRSAHAGPPRLPRSARACRRRRRRSHAFVADDRPDAWERLIDTLLASPHYGER